MATAKKSAAKKAPAAVKKAAAPATSAVQDMQEAMTAPLKGAVEKLKSLKLPGVPEAFKNVNLQGAASAVLDNRRKDLKALVEANEKSYKGLQAVVQRQAEMLKTNIGEWQSAVKEIPGKDPKEQLAKLDEMGRAAFKQALADMKELAELAAKSQADAFNVVRDRINDNVKQVSDLLKSGGK